MFILCICLVLSSSKSAQGKLPPSKSAQGKLPPSKSAQGKLPPSNVSPMEVSIETALLNRKSSET